MIWYRPVGNCGIGTTPSAPDIASRNKTYFPPRMRRIFTFAPAVGFPSLSTVISGWDDDR